MTGSQGLVAVLHRNSDTRRAALASSHATSWESEDSTGPSDKWPVLAQHAESEALLLSYAVLPWPSTSLDACYQEPN